MARSSCWTEEGTPHGVHDVGAHVDWGIVEGRRGEEIAAASVGGGRLASKVGLRLRGGGQEIAAGKCRRRKVLNCLSCTFFCVARSSYSY